MVIVRLVTDSTTPETARKPHNHRVLSNLFLPIGNIKDSWIKACGEAKYG